MIDEYLARWGLIPDGAPITTRSSELLPVLRAGAPAMLKIARQPEERAGNALMVWWKGEGAAAVLEHDDTAILLERALGNRALAALARSGDDSRATGIICRVLEKLHAARPRALPGLVPLDRWFAELEPAATKKGGVLDQSLRASRELLSTPRDIVVLHGDIHHGNILDFGARGWLAIDPKGLIGERGFDFANLFCNPDREVALRPGRLAQQAALVAETARLDFDRLLQWILAYAGLSAAWSINEASEDPRLALEVAGIAARESATTLP